jgi:hypothetical protein
MLYHKMPLNPAFSTSAASAAAPDAKLTFNVNAFNGNNTNFGGCSAPKPKSMTNPATGPVQPLRDMPSVFPPTTLTKPRPGMIMPM